MIASSVSGAPPAAGPSSPAPGQAGRRHRALGLLVDQPAGRRMGGLDDVAVGDHPAGPSTNQPVPVSRNTGGVTFCGPPPQSRVTSEDLGDHEHDRGLGAQEISWTVHPLRGGGQGQCGEEPDEACSSDGDSAYHGGHRVNSIPPRVLYEPSDRRDADQEFQAGGVHLPGGRRRRRRGLMVQTARWRSGAISATRTGCCACSARGTSSATSRCFATRPAPRMRSRPRSPCSSSPPAARPLLLLQPPVNQLLGHHA